MQYRGLNQCSQHVFVRLILLGVVVLLGGCTDAPLLNPKGPIGMGELSVITIAFGLMLIVIIPVTAMALWFPRRYRESNPRSDYDPHWSESWKIDLIVWAVPSVIVTILGILVWTKTHQLEPSRPIDSSASPIDIKAVSLDWKWLFIYPDQDVATVNRLELPVNVPVSLELTSDTVVTSFFIPQLGSQIYVMAGKKSRLHLLADEPGVYTGQNQQFSGRGYADMNFKVIATSQDKFARWAKRLKQSSVRLDHVTYQELEKPSSDVSINAFSSVEKGLFNDIVRKYGAAPDASDPDHQADSGGAGAG